MTFAVPFPIPQPPPFDVDFDEIWGAITSDIAVVRQTRAVKPLQPRGVVLVGHEYLSQEHAPPRIVVVPTGARFTSARRPGRGQSTLSLVNANPNVFWTQWLTFEGWCWGDEDPAKTRQLYGFSTAIDLSRQLLGAMARNLGSTANLQVDGARFEQPRDVNRLGRLYIVSFAIGTSINDEPWIEVPGATAAQPGVAVAASVTATSPDGTQTSTPVTFGVP
jgi:hypothetical protein